jgi:hypothetical protein
MLRRRGHLLVSTAILFDGPKRNFDHARWWTGAEVHRGS